MGKDRPDRFCGDQCLLYHFPLETIGASRPTRSQRNRRRHFVWIFLTVAYLAFIQIGPRNSELPSPDGTRVARIRITSGSIVDSKFSSVMVHKNSYAKWQQVWSGEGWMAGGGEASPYLHWADNTHLVIYLHQSNEPANCIGSVEDILIECRAHNW